MTESLRLERLLLEPLSKATASQLERAKVNPNEYLLIETNDEGEDFIVQPRILRPANGPAYCKICSRVKEHWSHSEDYKARHEFVPPPVIEVNGDEFFLTSETVSSGAISWLKRVPEREVIEAGKKYRLAGTDFTALVIYHAWPEEKLVFTEDTAKLLFDYLIKRFFRQTAFAKAVANFKVNGVLPPEPKHFVDHPERPLAPYQKCGVYLMSNGLEGIAGFMEQGTGKTAWTIARIMTEARAKRAGDLGNRQGTMYRALIICPRQVRLNWQLEFNRFATLPGKVGVCRGGLLHRQKAVLDTVRDEADCQWSATIISQDSVASTFPALNRVKWDLVVIDESHNAKNPQSKRWKSLVKFRDSPRVEARMVLTGTPIANRLFDLWTQLEFLGKGLSGFKSFTNFRNFYGSFLKVDAEKSGSQVEKLIGYKNLPLIQERLTRLCYMVTKKEADLQLPDKVYDVYEVEMTKQQADWYSKIATELAIEIEGDLQGMESGSNKQLTVNHVLTKLLRLAQITSGHVAWDAVVNPDTMEELSPKKVEQIPGGNPKVDGIIEIIKEELAADPLGKKIVWACFIEDLKALSAAMHEAGINHVGYHATIHPEHRVKDASAAEEKINKDPDCKVFIGNPASAGEGMNILGYDRAEPDKFDTYVDHMIFMSKNWSSVRRSQAEDRAHRRGTRCNLRITDMLVPGTIDEKIHEAVLTKRIAALQIQDVRDILRGIVGEMK